MSEENGSNGGVSPTKVKTAEGFDEGKVVEVTIRGVVFYNGTDPDRTPNHIWIRAPGYGPLQIPKTDAKVVG